MSLQDIVDKIMEGVSTTYDGYLAAKILDYHQMAQRAKSTYRDDALYKCLKKESRKEYKKIANKKVKNFVYGQTDDFLK